MIQSSFRLLFIKCTMAALYLCAPVSAAYFDGSELVIIRGRAVCLDKTERPVDALFECDAGRYGFLNKASRVYLFAKGDSLAEIFNDARVRRRELQITARLGDSEKLELIKVQSLNEGKLHDLYYFCDVCNITSYVPGLCPCCRAEMEFIEKPT